MAGLVDDSQYEDVMQRSVSMDWIWRLIETDYDIQKTGRHFLKVDAITYNQAGAETPMAFYKRLRIQKNTDPQNPEKGDPKINTDYHNPESKEYINLTIQGIQQFNNPRDPTI